MILKHCPFSGPLSVRNMKNILCRTVWKILGNAMTNASTPNFNASLCVNIFIEISHCAKVWCKFVNLLLESNSTDERQITFSYLHKNTFVCVHVFFPQNNPPLLCNMRNSLLHDFHSNIVDASLPNPFRILPIAGHKLEFRNKGNYQQQDYHRNTPILVR